MPAPMRVLLLERLKPERKKDMQKYVALVKSIAVRDVQVCLSENTDLLEGDWQDFESAEVFLGI